jgi:hypothetical protein
MKLLSDEEGAKVSMAESAAHLREGQEYLDLEQTIQGVRRASWTARPTGRVLPRDAVDASTWGKIVVGTHGRHGIARWLLGSVAEGVVRHATCAVLIVPPAVAVAELPMIEPICPRCVEARKTSSQQELWCEQHRQRHAQRHTYHQRDRMSEDGSLPLVGR